MLIKIETNRFQDMVLFMIYDKQTYCWAVIPSFGYVWQSSVFLSNSLAYFLDATKAASTLYFAIGGRGVPNKGLIDNVP